MWLTSSNHRSFPRRQVSVVLLSLESMWPFHGVQKGKFMDAYLDKGRFRDLLSSIPVKVVLNDNTRQALERSAPLYPENVARDMLALAGDVDNIEAAHRRRSA